MKNTKKSIAVGTLRYSANRHRAFLKSNAELMADVVAILGSTRPTDKTQEALDACNLAVAQGLPRTVTVAVIEDLAGEIEAQAIASGHATEEGTPIVKLPPTGQPKGKKTPKNAKADIPEVDAKAPAKKQKQAASLKKPKAPAKEIVDLPLVLNLDTEDGAVVLYRLHGIESVDALEDAMTKHDEVDATVYVGMRWTPPMLVQEYLNQTHRHAPESFQDDMDLCEIMYVQEEEDGVDAKEQARAVILRSCYTDAVIHMPTHRVTPLEKDLPYLKSRSPVMKSDLCYGFYTTIEPEVEKAKPTPKAKGAKLRRRK